MHMKISSLHVRLQFFCGYVTARTQSHVFVHLVVVGRASTAFDMSLCIVLFWHLSLPLVDTTTLPVPTTRHQHHGNPSSRSRLHCQPPQTMFWFDRIITITSQLVLSPRTRPLHPGYILHQKGPIQCQCVVITRSSTLMYYCHNHGQPPNKPHLLWALAWVIFYSECHNQNNL